MDMFTTLMGFIFVVIVFMLYSWWRNRKLVATHHMCLVITKSRGLIMEMWPRAEGEIEAPPIKVFKNADKQSRTFYYRRPYSLDVSYPPFAKFPFSLLQVDAKASIYEEGSPYPILPDDIEAGSTPGMVNAMGRQKIVGQMLHGLESLTDPNAQGGGMGMNFGKNKLLVQIAIIVFAVMWAVSAYGAYLIIQFVPYATQWMSVR